MKRGDAIEGIIMPYRGGRRWLSFAAYFLFISVGLVTFFVPLPSFTSTVSLIITWVWSGMIAIGGAVGVVGLIKRSPAIEFAAIPLQATPISVFAIILIYRGMTTSSTSAWGSLVVGMLMAALACKLLARWFDIGWLVRRSARRSDGSQ